MTIHTGQPDPDEDPAVRADDEMLERCADDNYTGQTLLERLLCWWRRVMRR